MEKHSVARLVGAPPGYVGYEEGGYLTEAVRRRPYSVILLDEVEKAHPDVFNILLQVLDDGRLTDGQGRTVNFKNTVIIMTSNLGSDLIQAQYSIDKDKVDIESNNEENEYKDAQNYSQMKQSVMEVVGSHFRPEFINRVDDIVVFHPLGREQIKAIAKIQLAGLRQRLHNMGFKLEIAADALDKLAEAGFDPIYGARPLKRAIQVDIENPLAQALLNDSLKGNDTIRIELDEAKRFMIA